MSDEPPRDHRADDPAPPGDDSTPPGDQAAAGGDESTHATIESLFADLTGLAAEEDTAETRDEVEDVKLLLAEAHERGLIDSGVRRLRWSDVGQALVGSVVFASPLLVEDGVFDIGEYLFESTVSGVPVFLIANTLFVVFVTYALLEWTGRNKRETQVLFGVVPVRLFVVLGVSLVVATVLMTVWGRVGDWQRPAASVARINVIWTVGSLGAALGDIISDGDTAPVVADAADSRIAGRLRELPVDGKSIEPGSFDSRSFDASDRPRSIRQLSDGALVDAIHGEFDDLESAVGDADDRHEVNRIRERTVQAALDDVFGDRIRKYTSRDIAEAFVGSIVFCIPFLVEDGVFDVAAYFLSFRVGLFPVFFLANAAFVLLMILALVYWAGPQDVRMSRPIFGFVPRRLVGIAVVSFLTAAALMTMWGRVGDWSDPVVATARISVVWTVASFGAALGDVLPGESSGADISDEFGALGDRSGDRSENRSNAP